MTHEERMKVFAEVETGAVTDAMVQLGVGGWMDGIFPTKEDMVVCGRAVPVQFMIVEEPHQIIDQFQLVSMCRPGDVPVWNVPSDANIVGENIIHFVGNNRLGGIVIDGKTRDVVQIGKMGVPQFTRGVSIAPAPRNLRATKDTVNVPVICGGTLVSPGDYIFGDIDGVLVVPESAVDDVLRQAQLNMQYEKRMEAALDRNCTLDELKEVFKTKKLLTD